MGRCTSQFLYNYTINKFAKNAKTVRSSKKVRLVTLYLTPVLNLKAIQLKLWEEIGFKKKSLTDRKTDGQRRTDDGHKLMGKALADIISWAKNSEVTDRRTTDTE